MRYCNRLVFYFALLDVSKTIYAFPYNAKEAYEKVLFIESN